jgi:hypothetical protein
VSEATWITVLAIALCLAMPVYALVLLLPAARRAGAVDRWRMLLYLQAPLLIYLFCTYLLETALSFAPGLFASCSACSSKASPASAC